MDAPWRYALFGAGREALFQGIAEGGAEIAGLGYASGKERCQAERVEGSTDGKDGGYGTKGGKAQGQKVLDCVRGDVRRSRWVEGLT